VATLRTIVRTTLAADATLMALLTGGLKDWDTAGRTGLTLKNAVKEADGIRIKPVAVLTWSTESKSMSSYGPTRGRQRFFQLWAYADSSYATIEQMLRRAEVVLDRKQVTADDARLCFIHYVDDGPDGVADELGGALMRTSRYFVEVTRRY